MSVSEVVSPEPSPLDRSGLTYFSIHDQIWSARRSQWDYFSYTTKDRELVHGRPDEPSLLGFAWEPDLYVPNHYHDVDQVQVVVHGELWFGNRRARPQAGVFRSAGSAYSFKVGPNGATALELRAGGRFGTAFKEREAALVGDDAPTSIAGYVPPRTGHKVVFFDAASAAPGPAAGSDGLAGAAVPGIGVQTLVEAAGRPEMWLAGVILPGGSSVPSHSSEFDRIVYVLDGELVVEGGQQARRSGDGWFWPAGLETGLRANPAGAHLLEFRCAPTGEGGS